MFKDYNKIFIIYILLTISFIDSTNSLKCGSKNLNVTPGIVETLQKNNSRNLEDESDNFKELVIGFDYTSFYNNSVEESIKNQIRELLEEVSSLFKKFLKIKTKPQISDSNLKKLIKTRCKIEAELPDNITETINTNDITIFPYFKEFTGQEEDSTYMNGRFCLITRDLRPIGGFIQINKDINFNLINAKEYYKHILFHQMTHILLFDAGLLDALGMIKDNQIITETVKKVARHHFNCMEFLLEEDFGLPLEEDNEHWDSRYMLGDYMVSFDYFDKTISDMTFALFDDSGIYQTIKIYGKYFNFGREKNCSFIQSECSSANFNEFCSTLGEAKCSQSRMSKGYCTSIKEADNCLVSNYETQNDNYFFSTSCKYENNNQNEDPYEIYGNDSFCFISSINNINNNYLPKCYKVACDPTNRKIIVYINNTQITTCSNGETIYNPNGIPGNLICPKYTEICSEDNNYICKDMLDCFDEKFARDYTIHEEDFSELIRFNILFIFINLFIFLFS